MVSDSIVILVSAILPLIFLYLFTKTLEVSPKYINMALFKISEGETADSRFYIIYRLIMEVLPGLVLILLFMLFKLFKKQSLINTSDTVKLSLVFFSLGMAGILPILTTMDQSTYFLYLSLPFFAVSFALFLNSYIEPLVGKINYKSAGYRFFKVFGVVALSSSLILSVYFSKEINRDKNMIRDMRIILPHIKENSTINILPEMKQNYSLFTYYARYKDVSLDIDLNNRHEYLLIATSLYSDTLNKSFDKIDLKTAEYALFRRKIIGK
ncbi:MAG: hypothetical protein IPN68_04450 [Bacteroidetes bacterium]|nr:hypothetical protein [Bacteroidota bacterium]